MVKYGLNLNPKENFKKYVVCNGILRPKGPKIKEKSNDLLPLNSAHPSKSLHKTQKCMKLFEVVVPTQNPTPGQKNQQKVHKQRL